jgi:hypothetical protein
LRILQLIQILSINAETLAELSFARVKAGALTHAGPVSAHEKGGIRIAEAAFRAGNPVVLVPSRFTAR